MRIGFTGTQNGMSLAQKITLKSLLYLLSMDTTAIRDFHHGMCIGADEQASLIAKEFGFFIYGHPPINQIKVSAKAEYNVLRDVEAYLDRNHTIVNQSQILIATPETRNEIIRSGTWSTIRYARKCSRAIFIIEPSGILQYEH